MSNSLGIFGNLVGYLTASVSGNKDAESHYYLQRYYAEVPHAKKNDVASAFTDGLVRMALQFRKFDISTGAVPSLKTVLTKAVATFVNGLNVQIITIGPGSTVTGVTATVTANKVSGLGLATADVATYKNALTNAINASAIEDSDRRLAVANLAKCTLGTSVAKEFSLVAGDASAQVNSIKEQLTAALNEEINACIKSTYTVNYITGSSDLVKEVLTKLKSGNVSDAELSLFNDFLQVRTSRDNGNTWDRTDASSIDLNNLSNYRINILTESAKIDASGQLQKVPSIVLKLPLLEPSNRVWYNTDKIVSSPDEDLLRRVFHEVYARGNAPTSLPNYDLNKMSAGLQPDLETMMRDILTKKTTPSAHIADDETDKIDAAIRRANWKRIGEDTWETVLADGSPVKYTPGTPLFEDEVSAQVNNCAAVGFANDINKCRDFLTEIANNNNSEQLGQLASQMNDAVSGEVVAKLHPKYALAILKSFGFHRKLCSDSIAGRQIEKVQRVEDWKKNFVNKKFSVEVANKIKSNPKLLNFLDLLAQLVNSNPSILNDSYAGETEESVGNVVVPDDLVKRRIVPVQPKNSGKPVLSWGTINDKMSKIYGSFSKGLTFNGNSTNSPLGMDNIFPSIVLPTAATRVVGSTWGSMSGGGDTKVFLQEHDTALEYSNNINKTLLELVSNLKASGKELSKDDIATISVKIGQFEQLEKELYETAQNIQTYSQLIKVLEAEKKREIITDAHIRKYVEKYNHLLNRYEKTGSSLSTLVSLLSDCSGSNSTNCETNGAL